ncbi:PP2C family protein-serine/threonine phosphatase [Sulfuriroseicoccus oceanibius]|uniref:SpoIIE family protein phosphatase n=1 Tax=Sulfuriroseicoccus oceanibius TaxID=2707525 RepID=A0A6B3L4E2_9BACT|nr:SpoIIE family protein phosphatase [Sulfuriroseicoccus oceanibius]QQL45589.1 SpoIIE family protein phosphatase [Sulfuriroseicoccus oceanibius]
MAIKHLFIGVVVGWSVLVIALVALVWASGGAHKDVAVGQHRRYESFHLADELRQSSDDLTRLVRAYVATGDPRYRQYFYEVVAIRNGESPRPQRYERSYWDLVGRDGTRPTEQGEAKSLEDRMRELQFTDHEFELLQQAREKSDALATVEEDAMQAVNGVFRDEEGNFTVQAAPNQHLAMQLVYNDRYHRAKAEIMRTINEFIDHVDKRTSDEVMASLDRERFYLYLSWPLGGLAVLVSLALFGLIAKYGVVPLRRLRAAVVEFSDGKYHRRPQGDRAAFSEVQDLARSFDSMSDVIVRDIDHRKKVGRELEVAKNSAEAAYRKVKEDLEAAAKIQHALLPSNMPVLKGYKFAFAYQPCEELGGDTLNVFPLDEDRVGVYLLDVSGHGVQAALLASTLSHVMSPMRSDDSVLWQRDVDGGYTLAPPRLVAQRLNVRFPINMETVQYFTIHYGVLNVREGSYRFISAGHPGPRLVSASGDCRTLDAMGPGIGLIEGAKFEEGEAQLERGDRVLFFSDGVLEAANSDGELYQDAQLQRCVKRLRKHGLKDCLRALIVDVVAWSDGEQEDDVSVVAIEVTGDSG